MLKPKEETDMTARTPRIVNPWFAPLYSFKRMFAGRRSKRRATIGLDELDDRMLRDIGLDRIQSRLSPESRRDFGDCQRG
jgi:uncharacterized protein YjiS (DUF1127 family)